MDGLRWMDRELDRWTEVDGQRWTDGWSERWTDREADSPTHWCGEPAVPATSAAG